MILKNEEIFILEQSILKNITTNYYILKINQLFNLKMKQIQIHTLGNLIILIVEKW